MQSGVRRSSILIPTGPLSSGDQSGHGHAIGFEPAHGRLSLSPVLIGFFVPNSGSTSNGLQFGAAYTFLKVLGVESSEYDSIIGGFHFSFTRFRYNGFTFVM